MSILATKLFRPPPRAAMVERTQLLERLDAGVNHRLTLISAPAGSGKTMLLSAWLERSKRPVAWLALEAGDRDPVRFLQYLIAALQTQAPAVGHNALSALRSPQPPTPPAILTLLLNDLVQLGQPLTLVLDDYHLLDSAVIDAALDFLLSHLPRQLHLVLATREDPALSLSRLRAANQITELRAADLRFIGDEIAAFLGDVMGLSLTPEQIHTLGQRTEGWVAGLQLAALSIRHHSDPAALITAFSGSNRFILDYLLEEVLQQQSTAVQDFLLHTAVLERICGPLCDAVLETSGSQALLMQLERANLFIIPLDNERRWYRYHHLFGELLRQRLGLRAARPAAQLHQRASAWFEAQGLELEAFQHAVAAQDTDRAARLLEGNGMPLLFRGATAPVMAWLDSLPAAALDARPALRVMHASVLLFAGQLEGLQQRIQRADAALQAAPASPETRDLHGHLALIRATLAVTQHDDAAIVAHAEQALELLAPTNLPVRTAASWALGYAYHLRGERAAAAAAYASAAHTSAAIGHYVIHIMATTGLAHLHVANNQLTAAVRVYHQALELIGPQPLQIGCEALLGLAQVHSMWNDLATAQEYGQRSVVLARQLPSTDRSAHSLVTLAHIRLAHHDVPGAQALLADAVRAAPQPPRPPVIHAQVTLLLHQGQIAAARQLAATAPLPLTQAQVALAAADPQAARTLLEQQLAIAETRKWPDEQLSCHVLLAVAWAALDANHTAHKHLVAGLRLADGTGLVRVFIEAGAALLPLLIEVRNHGTLTAEGQTALAALAALHTQQPAPKQSPIEPLTRRELEVLQLIAQGLSNQEISTRLHLALDTVKGYNRNTFGKLQVRRRTEAIARARELGLI